MAGRRKKGKKANAKMVSKPASNSSTSRSGKGVKQGDSIVGTNSIGDKYKFTEIKHKRDALTGEFINKPGLSSTKKNVGKSFNTGKKELQKVNKNELKNKLQKKLQSLNENNSNKVITIDVASSKEKLVKTIKQNEVIDKNTDSNIELISKIPSSSNTEKYQKNENRESIEKSKGDKKSSQDDSRERIKGLTKGESEEGYIPTNSKLTQHKANEFEAALNSKSIDALDSLIADGDLELKLRKSLTEVLKLYEDETERTVITQFLISDQPTKAQQNLADKVRIKLLEGKEVKPLTDKQMISAKNTMIKHFEKGKLQGDKLDSLTLTEANIRYAKEETLAKQKKAEKLVGKKNINERIKNLDTYINLTSDSETEEMLRYVRLLTSQEEKQKKLETLNFSLLEKDKDSISMIEKLSREGNEEVEKSIKLINGVANTSLDVMTSNNLKANKIEQPVASKPKKEKKITDGELLYKDKDSANKYIDEVVKNVELSYSDHKFSKLSRVEPRLVKLAKLYGYSSSIKTAGRESIMGFADPKNKEINITPQGLKKSPEFINSIMRHELIHAIQGSTGLKEGNFDKQGRYTTKNITPLGIDATAYIKPSEAFNALANYSPDKWAIELEAFTSNKAQLNGNDLSIETLATALNRDKSGLNKDGKYDTDVDWWKEVVTEGKSQGKEAYTRSVVRNASEFYPKLKPLIDTVEPRLDGEKTYIPIDKLSQDDIKIVSRNTDIAKPKFIFDQELRNEARKSTGLVKESLTDSELNISPERRKVINGVIDSFASDGGIKSIKDAINNPTFKLSDLLETKSLINIVRDSLNPYAVLKDGDTSKLNRTLMVTSHNLDISMFYALNNMTEKQKENAISTLSITPKSLSSETNGILNFYL